jgi:hypothetical protein
MVGSFGRPRVSVKDVVVGHARDLLAEAGVVIGVDVSTDDEEVVHGRLE